MSTARERERDEARASLLEWISPGETVYTVLRHRSASGMSRTIALVVLRDNEPRWIGCNAARLMDDRYDRDREGIKVSGCGMDMGFHLVYNLGSALWPDGFTCTGADCPSNAHTNGAPTPHPFPTEPIYTGAPEPDLTGPCPVYKCGRPAAEHPTQPEHHTSGGYALRHRWL